jgi:hypothetical protein
MRKGDRIVVTAGPYRGMGGSVRRRCRDGRFIVNLFAPGRGIAASPRFQAGEIRRVEKRTK